jgi:HAD superfamily hydrolase (TIGR01490 family)
VTAAAFFDLDHTLISRATPLALANTFRKRGLIRRRDLVRAAAWHLIFLLRGLGEAAVRKGAEDGMVLLKGVRVAEIEEMLGDAMAHVLCPLVYAEPIDLLEEHRSRDEPAYVLSASLHEIVEYIALDLGFDGAIGSTCEIVDGVYTGKSLRPCYGAYKADALHELAAREGLDLDRSTAYSDSHTDLAFLEAVGHPVAVNPDARLREIAEERGWPVLTFTNRLVPRDRAPVVRRLSLAGLAVGAALLSARRHRRRSGR